MVEQIFLSLQVKRIVVISNKLVYSWLTHELPNDLRLRVLGNQEISGKSQNFIELLPSAQSPSKNENFKNRNLTFPVVRYFS